VELGSKFVDRPDDGESDAQQCDSISEQHNTHMIQKGVHVWATMNRTTLHENRMDLINHMESVLAQNLTSKYGEGRGIVMVAGNADTLKRVKWSLQMMRKYGTKLPVQVVCGLRFHFAALTAVSLSQRSASGR